MNDEKYVLTVKGPAGEGWLACGTLDHCNRVYDMLEINAIWLDEYFNEDADSIETATNESFAGHWPGPKEIWPECAKYPDDLPFFAAATLSNYDTVSLYTADRTKKYWLDPVLDEKNEGLPGPTPAPWHPNPTEQCWQEVGILV